MSRHFGSASAYLQSLDPTNKQQVDDYDDEDYDEEEEYHEGEEGEEEYWEEEGGEGEDDRWNDENLDEEAAEYVYDREKKTTASAFDFSSLLQQPPLLEQNKQQPKGGKRRNSNNNKKGQKEKEECLALQEQQLAQLRQHYSGEEERGVVRVSAFAKGSRLLQLSFTNDSAPRDKAVTLKVAIELGEGFPLLETAPRSINASLKTHNNTNTKEKQREENEEEEEETNESTNDESISSAESALVQTLVNLWSSSSAVSASSSSSSMLLSAARVCENWLAVFIERRQAACVAKRKEQRRKQVAAELVRQQEQSSPSDDTPKTRPTSVLDKIVDARKGNLTFEQRLQMEYETRYASISREELAELLKNMAHKLKQQQEKEIRLQRLNPVATTTRGLLPLRTLCLKNMAKHLLYYESLEGVPLFIRTRIFGIIVQNYILHPLHLALLLEDDVKKLDLSPQAAFITDEHLYVISLRCRNLRNLNLQGCAAITDEGLASICSTNHQMAKINLQGCKKLTSRSLAALAADCPNLVSINLCHVGFEGQHGLEQLIRRCDRLEVFLLAGTKTSVATLIRLLQCSRTIRVIDVSYCSNAHKTSVEVPNMKICKAVQLETLYMNETKWLSPSVLRTIFAFRYPRLQHVSFTNLPRATSLPLSIFTNSSLNTVNLANIAYLSPDTVRAIADNLSGTLRSLDISGPASMVQSSTVAYILKCCTSLTDLSVRNCPLVSGLLVLKSAVHHPSLISLDISNTNDTVGGIIESELNYRVVLRNKLQRLRAKSCSWLIDFYLIDLVSKCFPSLHSLNVKECAITEEGLMSVILECTQLTSLKISLSTVSKRIFYSEERLKVRRMEKEKEKQKAKEKEQSTEIDPDGLLLKNLREFSCKEGNIRGSFVPFVPMYLPRLERLSVCFSSIQLTNINTLLENLCRYTPKLRYLNIDTTAWLRPEFLPDLHNMPTSNLRHLRELQVPHKWLYLFARYFPNAVTSQVAPNEAKPLWGDDGDDGDDGDTDANIGSLFDF